jgi:uncharacterized protein DUF4232
MLRNRILVAAGVMVAIGAAGCSGNVSGSSGGPQVPSFGSTAPTGPTAPSGPSSGPSTPPPASSPGEQSPPDAATAEECKASELTLSIGHGDAAAGTAFRPLRLTNSGKRTCTIQGFPGVSYVAGDDGHQVGPAAFREGTKGAAVRLAPGETAFATVGFVQVHNFDPNVCKPTPVRGLRVYPPHDTASLFLALEGTGCAGTPPGNQLTVRTVQKGQGGD